MRTTTAFLGILLTAGLAAAFTPFDLDVDVPSGNPFDSIKMPKDTPTGGTRGGVETRAGPNKPPVPVPAPAPAPASGGAAGATVAEDPKKAPPPKPPLGLPGITSIATVDWPNHLKWNPSDKNVLREFEDRPDVATGTDAGQPVKWEFKEFPPSVPNNMYVYCLARYLMVMLHRPMVSERELTEFLIEMGYPARYAGTACVGEKELEAMAKAVIDAEGPMVENPPAKPPGEVAQRVYLDLLTRYPYDSGFAGYILSQPSEVTLPILLKIVTTQKHPFLVRNAVFVLRCFNNPEVVPVLRTLLTKTQDKVIRNRALAALARWQDEEVVPWLVKQLAGPDVSFKSMVLWALGRIGSPLAIDPVIAFTKASLSDRETLWAAIPALGWLGESALGDKKKKVEDFLVSIKPAVNAVAEPPGYDGRYTAVKTPDPPNASKTLLDQRLVMALALCGRPQEVDVVKKWTLADVLKPNQDYFQETQKKLK
jgi:HEAT repeat protein